MDNIIFWMKDLRINQIVIYNVMGVCSMGVPTPFGSVKSALSITGSNFYYAEATVLHNQIAYFSR